jgi:hypothetical protein
MKSQMRLPDHLVEILKNDHIRGCIESARTLHFQAKRDLAGAYLALDMNMPPEAMAVLDKLKAAIDEAGNKEKEDNQ